MVDLVEVAKRRIEQLGYTGVYLKRFDSFTGKEAICVRPVQPTVLSTYMDGTQEVMQPYQVIVRRRSEAEAMTVCCDIAEKMDAEVLHSENGSYDFNYPTVYVNPAELQLEEENFYAWVVTMAAHITVS